MVALPKFRVVSEADPEHTDEEDEEDDDDEEDADEDDDEEQTQDEDPDEENEENNDEQDDEEEDDDDDDDDDDEDGFEDEDLSDEAFQRRHEVMEQMEKKQRSKAPALDQWVVCDSPSCQKWRVLGAGLSLGTAVVCFFSVGVDDHLFSFSHFDTICCCCCCCCCCCGCCGC